jgi:DNA-binding IclR family transcriptional regulator
MGCVNPDGTLTQSAKAMLEVLNKSMTAEDAAAKAQKPVYLVRAKLRELVEAGLVERDGETYLTTAAGWQKLE